MSVNHKILHSLGGIATIAIVLTIASPASAASAPAPGWGLDGIAQPTVFSAADNNPSCEVGGEEITKCDSFQVTATEAGARAAEDGIAPIVVSDEVPAGLVVAEATLELRGIRYFEEEHTTISVLEGSAGPCKVEGQLVSCEYLGSEQPNPGTLQPDQKLVLSVKVTVPPGTPAGPLPVSKAKVSGGGAVPVEALASSSVGSPPSFGVSNFGFFASSPNGGRDVQAGDHPYELTTTIDLNSEIRQTPLNEVAATSVEDVKDIVVNLPVGFVGSILAAPQCSFSQLASSRECPADTRVGYLYTFPETSGDVIHSFIYNMTPALGVAAEFAYVDVLHTPHVLFAHVVPTAKGYVLQTTSNDIPQVALTKIIATFWGNPALRDESGQAQIPFFTNPTDCAGEEPTASIYIDSWQHPAQVSPNGIPANLGETSEGKALWASGESKAPPVSGCNALSFTPELIAQPTTHEADKPSGLEFELKVPQTENNGVLATPTLKRATVTLPEGYTVDPAAGNGLAACSTAQIGWQGTTLPDGERLPPIHGPHGEEPNPGYTNFDESEPACPEASKIGSLELETPLVPHPIVGELFLAAQDENPYHSTLAAYVVVHDPVTGVLIKIPGEFLPDPSTGRLTAIFGENPNLPFSDLKLHFFGGPRAELATPEACGTFTTGSVLEPWSSSSSGSGLASPFDSFFIDEACPGGFAPSFTAGTTNLQAGAYTPFEVSFQRQDTDEELAGLTATLPPGLLANVGSVPLCGEAQANAGTCPESSQVGTVQTGVGPGSNPLFVNGKAYLTGPYNGGPYGLSVVVPAVAGPFNFGTVVVRQSIRIDPTTAQVTDVSDPFPTIIDGIPLRLRRVDVVLNRPGFTFNATSCNKLGFTGSISGSPLGSPRTLKGTVGYATQAGATAPVSEPFQVTNCSSLKFEPKLSASTSGKTSKADGASLTYKVSYPKVPQGTDADIQYVKVELPSELPSRLTTLQKACTAAQFDSNPAGCPAASVIGHAAVHTQILPAPLEGPVYFVSNGGEAFPNLVMVLQGDNVEIQLVGDTLIKNGVTSTTFKTVPDTPFETFEINLPEGKFSALAANANLCKPTVAKTVKKKVKVKVKGREETVTRKIKEQVSTSLTIPSDYIAQNGTPYTAKVPVSVTGCPRTRAKAKVVKKKSRKGKGRGRKKK